MFPGMVFLILSRDPDFVDDMSALLRQQQCRVYVATSWDEMDRLREEMAFEMLVVDPYFRLV
jgi:hypothetical protein